MSRFVIAFNSELKGVGQSIVEASSSSDAIKTYFESFVVDYSQDAEGYACFWEDFHDESSPMGSVLEI
jgi:hypothetical protein|tara:strand:- start:1553 stop:1756 length:204 start_codon:yes stop_codon:yes gene_type:complete